MLLPEKRFSPKGEQKNAEYIHQLGEYIVTFALICGMLAM